MSIESRIVLPVTLLLFSLSGVRCAPQRSLTTPTDTVVLPSATTLPFTMSTAMREATLPPSLSPTPTAPTATAINAQSSTPSQANPASASPTLPPADVVVTTEKNGQRIITRVGQVIEFTLPPINAEWTVSYYQEMLVSLTAPDKMGNPGSGGWFFRVVAPGESDVMFTSIARCSGATPCPQTVARFTYTIKAEG